MNKTSKEIGMYKIVEKIYSELHEIKLSINDNLNHQKLLEQRIAKNEKDIEKLNNTVDEIKEIPNKILIRFIMAAVGSGATAVVAYIFLKGA